MHITPDNAKFVTEGERALDQITKAIAKLDVIAALHGNEYIKPLANSLLLEASTLIDFVRRVS